MALIDEINSLPDISFIGNATLDSIQAGMVEDYQAKYLELTGEETTLQRADPITLLLYACSVQLYQAYLYVDRAGKMDLLKYSYGGYLDNLAAFRGITREPAKPAVCTVRFTLSAARAFVVSVPAGTRVSDGTNYFATNEYAEIPAGSLYVDVLCTCQDGGTAANGILPGGVNTLVDPIAYMDSVANVDETAGGADVEDDETLAGRVYLAPSAYSVAGPEDAYRYYVLTFNSSISDVYVSSTETDGEVLIEFLIGDGEIPGASLIQSLSDYLQDQNIRPLTDHVVVQAPATVSFDINVTYYINRSDSNRATAIQADVAAAVAEFKKWQVAKIGRDINPDKLVSMLLAAGAKRVIVTSPGFTSIPNSSVARVNSTTATYGGLEDD